jgi:hypothetical protein
VVWNGKRVLTRSQVVLADNKVRQNRGANLAIHARQVSQPEANGSFAEPQCQQSINLTTGIRHLTLRSGGGNRHKHADPKAVAPQIVNSSTPEANQQRTVWTLPDK